MCLTRVVFSFQQEGQGGVRICSVGICFVQGMAMVELLRQLERRAGAPIWTLFDVIGGTSTGGLLAVSLGLLRLNLDACQEIYTSLGNKVRAVAFCS
jgi:patatin-like phospholipase/acyl hydrolase